MGNDECEMSLANDLSIMIREIIRNARDISQALNVSDREIAALRSQIDSYVGLKLLT